MADMTDVVFWRGGTQDLEAQPIIDGQLLYDTDTGKIYMDNGSERKELSKQEAVALKPLNFTGAVTETYDGTAEKTINIPQGGSSGSDIFVVTFTKKSGSFGRFSADKKFSEIYGALQANKTVIGRWVKDNDWTGGDKVNTYIVGAYGNQQIEFTDTNIQGEAGDYIKQNKLLIGVDDSVTQDESKISTENGLVLYASGAPDAELKTVVYHSGNKQTLEQGRIVSIVMQEANTATAVKMKYQGNTYELYASLYDRTVPEIAKGTTLLCQVQEGAFVWLNRDLTGGGSGGVQPDWNQNDETAPDYIKNRICYSKDPVESVFAPEQSITLTAPDRPTLITTTAAKIKSATKYQVVINGDVYNETSYFFYLVNGNVIGKGNPPATFDPFLIAANPEGGGQVALFTSKYSGDITISIKEIQEEVVKLPNEYLSEEVFKKVGRASPNYGEIFNNYFENIASGHFSHSEGYKTRAYGNYSHCENYGGISFGEGSHCEGRSYIGSYTPFGNCRVEVQDSKTLKITSLEEQKSIPNLLFRLIGFDDSIFTYFVTNYEEDTNIATFFTDVDITTGTHSIEIYEVSASVGSASHAEGTVTVASGGSSHAEGESTTASGNGSHAEGSETIAVSAYQHVQGKHNIPDTSDGTKQGTPNNKYAHIVGNGSYSARSNAHTLDWQGNSWYQGNVLIGGKDMDAPMGVFAPDHIIIKASDSEDRFKITVDKTGAIKAEKVV